MLLRGILVLVPFRNWSFYCLIFFYLILPIYLQFVTFTLLIVFFQKCLLVIRKQADMVRSYLYPAYQSLCGVLLLFCILVAGVITWKAPVYSDKDSNARQKEATREFDKESSLYTSISYFTLVLLVCLYGLKVYRVLSTVAISERKRQKVNIFIFMSCIFTVVFFLRALWGMTYFFSVNPVMNYSARSSTGAYYTAMMLFYFVAEVLPTLMIVIVFHVFLRENSEDRTSLNSDSRLLWGSQGKYSYY